MKILTDDDLMPFGKHKGIKMMHVPVRYLHYLWLNGMKSETPTNSVARYIEDNIDMGSCYILLISNN